MEAYEKDTRVTATLEPLLTRTDLQQLLRLSGRTIGRLIVSGGLPSPIRVGQSHRWRVSDIQQFITSQAAAGDGVMAQSR